MNLQELDRADLVKVIEWLANELSNWMESESVATGMGSAKRSTPDDLIAYALAVVGSSTQ